ncbi:hypothetical protein PAL_GLEAN10014852 [Pteropus alecto]|uniref:Uncharacterized protein n=1 Tax=Pteropus alecto TaxID=9402 RepID=L5KMC7_PTEAL|nr:hypothetical protein PAL_GLEAN10014852 [Pteropus alecto]
METGGWLSGASAEMESCFHLEEENIRIPLRPNGWKTFSPDPKNPVSMALPRFQYSSYLSETDLIGPPFFEKTSVGSHRIVNF